LPELPSITVVTPVLNGVATLPETLASVREQDYPRIEHVVVDGGSTDGTVELLARSGVRWISEADSGQAEAINKGFALATGTWLTWLNADDVLLPGAVARILAAPSVDSAVEWVYGDCEIVEPERTYVLRPSDRIDPVAFEESNPLAQPGTFVARSALDRVGPLDEELHLAMDFDLWLRLADAGVRAVYVPETLASFVFSSSSKSGSIPWGEFLREEAVSLLRSGRVRTAALRAGKAAAWNAFVDGRIESRLLKREIRRLASELGLPEVLVRAGARTEAAFLEPPASAAAYRHVLTVAPWRVRETRELLLSRL